jgi:hypothetical protein
MCVLDVLVWCGQVDGSPTGQAPGAEEDLPPVTEPQVKKLLDPLSRDQLYAILLKLGLEYETVLNEIKAVAQRDPSRTKLFVRYVLERCGQGLWGFSMRTNIGCWGCTGHLLVVCALCVAVLRAQRIGVENDQRDSAQSVLTVRRNRGSGCGHRSRH